MKKVFTQFIICALCATWSFAQDCTIGSTIGSTCELTMTGTVTIPAGVDMIEVKAWGAGGGSLTASTNRRGGGGGGAYFTAIYSVTAGSTLTATSIGQGAADMDGGNTVFNVDGGTPVTVNGGKVGTTNAGGAGGIGQVNGGDGGARASGGGDGGGGGGGSGPGNGDGMNGTNGGTTGGAGGTAGSPGAAGGNGGDNGQPGFDGLFPGGGAGGKGSGNNAGAAGGNGQVIVCVTGVLPIELVSFNANAKDNEILLEWQTASELNNRGFEIQKSNDGIDWDILEFVEGNGTTTALNTYSYMDSSPIQGTNYYRLKQLDFDGEFEYTKSVIVDFDQLNVIGIFPNPVKDQLTLVNGEGNAIIYNVLGQAVKHFTIDVDQINIQLTDLLDGQYYLQVIRKDGTVGTTQFSKTF